MRHHIRMLAIALLVVGAGVCSAGEWGLWEHVDGKPKEKGDTERCLVWHVKDGNRWEVRFETKEHKHHFKGEIKLEGPGHFTDIKHEGEKWTHAHVKQEPEKGDCKRIYFDFTEKGTESGFGFTTEKCGAEDKIKWELFFGGEKESDACESHPDRIFVGHKGEHPEHGRFLTWCHPDEKHHGK
jgi:hypothetical protein